MNDTFLSLIIPTLDSTLRVSTPLIFAALAGMYSERSGIVDIGLEGKMLVAAFAAASVAHLSGSAWIGLGAAILAAIAFSMIHGFACITHKGDQVVSGVAINILASGLTMVLGLAWFHKGGQTPTVSGSERFSSLSWPYASEEGQSNGMVDLIYSDLISGHNILVYLALLAVPLTWWILQKTRFGLHLRAVGENPKAVDTAGISVTWLRYRALIITGLLCGFAGAYLSIAQNAGFNRDMTAGQGYMALAAVIFGKWRPWTVLFACLLFGFLDAVAMRLQSVDLPLIGAVPVQLIEALPYLLTVILLAGFIGKAIAPKAIGQPYVKER